MGVERPDHAGFIHIAVFELAIVVFLILLNGLFALSELSVVSARRAKLKAMAAAGRSGAARALELADDPGKFLSAVQIGITLIGIVNGAYSGDAFGAAAASLLADAGVPDRFAGPLGFALVIALITYLSVIIGELVPKNLALGNAEGIACAVAPAMALFARFAAPAVWILDASTRLVFRIFGRSAASDTHVTDEEIKMLIAEAESAGVIEKGERQMISGVMRLADRAVVGLMTPRTDVDWIDLSSSDSEIRDLLSTSRHSRLPVGESSTENLIGVVPVRNVLVDLLAGRPLEIRKHVRKAPIIPETTDALDVLRLLREAEVPMALIHDEYGHFEGLVTPADILEAIAGAFRSDLAGAESHATERGDGTWLISGAMPADEMAELLDIRLPPQRDYTTTAGYLLAHLQHLPRTGETLTSDGWRFEVVDLDGRRIDKVLASRSDS